MQFPGLGPCISSRCLPSYDQAFDCKPGLNCHWNSAFRAHRRAKQGAAPPDPNVTGTPDAIAFHLPVHKRPPAQFTKKDVLTIGASMESTSIYPHQAEAWRWFDIVMALNPSSDVPLHYLGTGDQLRTPGVNISLDGVGRVRLASRRSRRSKIFLPTESSSEPNSLPTFNGDV